MTATLDASTRRRPPRPEQERRPPRRGRSSPRPPRGPRGGPSCWVCWRSWSRRPWWRWSPRCWCPNARSGRTCGRPACPAWSWPRSCWSRRSPSPLRCWAPRSAWLVGAHRFRGRLAAGLAAGHAAGDPGLCEWVRGGRHLRPQRPGEVVVDPDGRCRCVVPGGPQHRVRRGGPDAGAVPLRLPPGPGGVPRPGRRRGRRRPDAGQLAVPGVPAGGAARCSSGDHRRVGAGRARGPDRRRHGAALQRPDPRRRCVPRLVRPRRA